MFKFIFLVSLQYFAVLSVYPEPEWWPYPEDNYPVTPTQPPTTCPSCISQINDECNVKTYGCNNKDCCTGLNCQLYNPNVPEFGGTCQCPVCQQFNQSCLAFSLGCNRNGCCPGLRCVGKKPGDIASDKGGFCKKCPKCQGFKKRCRVIFPTGCNGNDCCKGLVCIQTNPNITDVGGICRPKPAGCPKCQPRNKRCEAFINNCSHNKCCKNLVCVKNVSRPDLPGVCTDMDDILKVDEMHTCSLNKTCNLPGEPCLNINSNTCAKNPCCDSNLYQCAGSSSDKPGVCQPIPIMDIKLND